MDQALKDRKTRQITIGGTKVGGNAPVVLGIEQRVVVGGGDGDGFNAHDFFSC